MATDTYAHAICGSIYGAVSNPYGRQYLFAEYHSGANRMIAKFKAYVAGLILLLLAVIAGLFQRLTIERLRRIAAQNAEAHADAQRKALDRAVKAAGQAGAQGAEEVKNALDKADRGERSHFTTGL